MDVLADTTPFVDGLGQLAGILPPWVARRRHRGRRSPELRDPETRAAAAHRVRPLLALHPQGRVASRAPAGERSSIPDWDGLTFAEIADLREADPWDCFFDVLADAGHGVREHPRRRPALHRRAHGRDDLAPALLPRRRHVHGDARTARWPTSCAIRSATPATSTTSRTTCGRTGRCAWRRRSAR